MFCCCLVLFCFLQILALSCRLDAVVPSHCNLHLLGLSKSRTSASQVAEITSMHYHSQDYKHAPPQPANFCTFFQQRQGVLVRVLYRDRTNRIFLSLFLALSIYTYTYIYIHIYVYVYIKGSSLRSIKLTRSQVPQYTICKLRSKEASLSPKAEELEA